MSVASTFPRLQNRWAVIAIAVFAVSLWTACAGGSQVDDSQRPAEPQALTSLQQEARQVLAERLSAPANELMLISDESVQWADSSLGCPVPGMMYLQVITPGHRITFNHNGTDYEVHTAVGGDSGPQPPMVSCEGGVSY